MRDIKKTQTPNLFAVATLGGLFFIEVYNQRSGFKIVIDQTYLQGLFIRAVVEVKKNIFVACVNERSEVYKIYKDSAEVITIAGSHYYDN